MLSQPTSSTTGTGEDQARGDETSNLLDGPEVPGAQRCVIDGNQLRKHLEMDSAQLTAICNILWGPQQDPKRLQYCQAAVMACGQLIHGYAPAHSAVWLMIETDHLLCGVQPNRRIVCTVVNGDTYSVLDGCWDIGSGKRLGLPSRPQPHQIIESHALDVSRLLQQYV